MDADTVAAFERYVMATARCADGGEEAVREEQNKAIESLTQGTLFHYYLYFIDLAKRKDFDEMTEEETNLFNSFEERFAKTTEFLEVETAFQVLRRVEKLPQKVDENSKNEDVEQYIDVMNYIDTQINANIDEAYHA